MLPNSNRLQQPADRVDDFLRREGLAQGGAGAELLGVAEEVAVAEPPAARDRDDRQRRAGAVQFADRFDAFLRRHQDVADHQIGRGPGDGLETLFAVRRLHDGIAGARQYPGQRDAHQHLIVDQHNALRRHLASA